jgi:hypothetical protein
VTATCPPTTAATRRGDFMNAFMRAVCSTGSRNKPMDPLTECDHQGTTMWRAGAGLPGSPSRLPLRWPGGKPRHCARRTLRQVPESRSTRSTSCVRSFDPME